MPSVSSRPRRFASSAFDSAESMAANVASSGVMPSSLIRSRSMNEEKRSATFCPSPPASCGSSTTERMIERTFVSAVSKSSRMAPSPARSSGIVNASIHRPLMWRKRSSCGRTDSRGAMSAEAPADSGFTGDVEV
ncbi:Uncharacterised protein [Mycobacteroides abscessus subsp. abscessus]|nr:Uncharacterised protein [Mycobacteroides abscessus subsp. abscessus]